IASPSPGRSFCCLGISPSSADGRVRGAPGLRGGAGPSGRRPQCTTGEEASEEPQPCARVRTESGRRRGKQVMKKMILNGKQWIGRLLGAGAQESREETPPGSHLGREDRPAAPGPTLAPP